MSKTEKGFENRNTQRIIAGALAVAALAGAGVRLQQLDHADKLGPAQYHADHLHSEPSAESNK